MSDSPIKLDNKEYIKSLDIKNLFRIIDEMPDHIDKAVNLCPVTLPTYSEKINEIGVVGVGTTKVCAQILKSFLDKSGNVPVISINDFHLPSWVSKNTLLFFISFSGNTEEVLSCFTQCVKIGCPSVVITTGGELEKRASQNNIPVIKISKEVPQNRTVFAYLLVPLLVINIKMGLLSYDLDNIIKLKGFLEEKRQRFSRDVLCQNNYAKKISCELENYIPIIYTNDGSLEGVVSRWQYQFNENAKVPAYSAKLPEMSHNELIGVCGSDYSKLLKPILLLSESTDETMSKRLVFTLDALRSKGYEILEVPIIGNNELERIFYGIYLGDYVSYYSAILRGVDPHAVDLIDSIRINK
jgi:glucose/mannose-6-phosphate isomerase